MQMVEKVRTDASAAHSTLRERLPAGTALPADGSDGCLGLVDNDRARRLDGATDDNITLYDDAVWTLCFATARRRRRACVPPRPCLYLECSVTALTDIH